MIKFIKPLDEVRKEIESLDCKIESSIAQRLVDAIHLKLPDTISKTEIATVINAFFKEARTLALTTDTFQLPKIATQLKGANKKSSAKDDNLFLILIEERAISDNLECYVEDIIK